MPRTSRLRYANPTTLCALGSLTVVLISTYAAAAVAPPGHEDEINLISGVITGAMTETEILDFLGTAAVTESHVMIRFDRVITNAERDELQDRGLSLLSYVPYTAWLGRVGEDQDVDVAALRTYGIVWASYNEITYKTDMGLRAGDYSPWAFVPPNSVRVNVYFYPDVELLTIDQVLAAHGVTAYDYTEIANSVATILDGDAVTALAYEDEVMWMTEIAPVTSPANDGARDCASVNYVQNPPYDLDGAGVNVMIWEDVSVWAEHPALIGRVLYGEENPCTCWDPPPCLEHSHATQVAGTLAAGDMSNQYRGMAPAATLISYQQEQVGSGEIYNAATDFVPDVHAAIVDNNHSGQYSVDVINVSMSVSLYQFFPPTRYDELSQLTDRMVLGEVDGKAVPVCWAMGNWGASYPIVTVGAAAKNSTAVGGIQSDTYVHFGRHGPTGDGRIKPDICAAGDQASGDGGITTTNCPDDGGFYSTHTGTSYSTPVVTGIYALAIQKYRQIHGFVAPRPSTLKAILLNSADDLGDDGPEEGDLGPDAYYGYGKVNALSAIMCIELGRYGESALDHGRSQTAPIDVVSSSEPLKVMVVWDDPAAEVMAAVQLVNDIDVHLVSPTGVRFDPYKLVYVSGYDWNTETGRNIVDNVEQVVVNNPETGRWTLVVEGTAIHIGPQTYSYSVVGNTSGPVVPLPAASFHNRSAETNQLASLSGSASGAVAFDANGDDRLDLVVTMASSQPHLYWNRYDNEDGVPQFWDVPTALVNPPIGCTAAAAADYDNSGECDVLLTHFSDTRLYRNTTTEPSQINFTDVTATRLAPTCGSWYQQAQCVTWGDFNGDELLDLFIGRTGNPGGPAVDRLPAEHVILMNRGQFVPVPITGVGGGPVSAACYAASWHDIDQDGSVDLTIADVAGPLQVWIADDTQYHYDIDSYAFEEAAAGFFGGGGGVPQHVADFAWIDFTADGEEDLVVACVGNAPGQPGIRFYAKDGLIFTEVALASLNLDTPVGSPFVGVEVLDVDLNGYQDLVVVPAAGVANPAPRVLAGGLAGPGTLTDLTALDSANWDLGSEAVGGAVIAADFSHNDGDLDLYLGRHNGGGFFYQCRWATADFPPPPAPWVEITLTGTANNSSAMGAKVTWQGQTQVYGENGRAPQPVTFSSGPGARNLEIAWPNGHVENRLVENDGVQAVIQETGPYLAAVQATYEPKPGGATYIFTWDVKDCPEGVVPQVADAAVLFLKTYGYGTQCYCSEGMRLTAASPAVSVQRATIDENAGWYRFTLRWYDGCCVVVPGGCLYGYRVETDLGTNGLLRSVRRVMPSIQTCIKQLDPGIP